MVAPYLPILPIYLTRRCCFEHPTNSIHISESCLGKDCRRRRSYAIGSFGLDSIARCYSFGHFLCMVPGLSTKFISGFHLVEPTTVVLHAKHHPWRPWFAESALGPQMWSWLDRIRNLLLHWPCSDGRRLTDCLQNKAVHLRPPPDHLTACTACSNYPTRKFHDKKIKLRRLKRCQAVEFLNHVASLFQTYLICLCIGTTSIGMILPSCMLS